jgi:hypothetical protein
MGVFMLFGFPFIALIYFIWYVRVPKVADDFDYYSPDEFKPIGLKVWTLMLIVSISIIPFANVACIFVSLIWLAVQISLEGWSEVFGKFDKPTIFTPIGKFLNKELVKPKKNDSRK